MDYNRECQRGVAEELKRKIALVISARGLPDKDVVSKSDPMCVVWIASRDQTWTEHSRTEVIKNTLNPEFSTQICIDYHFEEMQKMKFAIYDIDHPTGPLNSQDFLGEATCTLGQIVSAGRLELKLAPHGGRIIIESHDMSNNKEALNFGFGGQQLANPRFLSEPNPVLNLYRLSPDGHKTLIHRSPRIKHTRRPNWPKFTVPIGLFEKDGAETKILIECLDHRKCGNHKLIGQIQLNCCDLYQSPKTFELTKPGKGTKSRGQLVLHEFTRQRIFDFLDYVYSGTQLNCSFAIDFTASNGDPMFPDSLHYRSAAMPSQYEVALRSVGEIIQDYDEDKQFPVLGFGALVPPTNQLSHEFFVNLSPNPYCSGVDGVVDAYRKCLKAVTLYGPTNFAPIIRHVTRFAASYPNGDHYFILLILTDGAICDMGDTKMALVDASVMPVSIIIVGIGSADFTAMEELDGDKVILQDKNGRQSKRDIVQFVAFRDFQGKLGPYQAGQELTKNLLKEIPDQLVSYMNSKGLAPGNKVVQ